MNGSIAVAQHIQGSGDIRDNLKKKGQIVVFQKSVTYIGDPTFLKSIT